MNAKGIKKHLNFKVNDWIESIDDEEVQKIVRENVIITGGALVSLLNGEEPNDYDCYFKDHDSCLAVAQYYADRWNDTHGTFVDIRDDDGKISCFIQSAGVAVEKDESAIDDDSEPQEEPFVEEKKEEEPVEKPKYRPRYFSSNAISLSDKIQIVIRFYGSVDKIHENYDYVHCTCSYDHATGNVNLPSRALEAIINKELYYTGSKYPLCSIIRSRKFIERGWHINAGQYLKMCLQLNELDLKNFNVFKDQLTGVDSAYFEQAIALMQKRKEEDPDFRPDNTYLFEVINRIF